MWKINNCLLPDNYRIFRNLLGGNNEMLHNSRYFSHIIELLNFGGKDKKKGIFHETKIKEFKGISFKIKEQYDHLFICPERSTTI